MDSAVTHLIFALQEALLPKGMKNKDLSDGWDLKYLFPEIPSYSTKKSS